MIGKVACVPKKQCGADDRPRSSRSNRGGLPKCNAAFYARLSTSDQHPEIQVDALRTHAEARGLEIAGEYVDHLSGALRAIRIFAYSTPTIP